MLDFVQRTGETVVVPAGWWRAAVNVSSSVAVAEDFVQAAALQATVDGVARPRTAAAVAAAVAALLGLGEDVDGGGAGQPRATPPFRAATCRPGPIQ